MREEKRLPKLPDHTILDCLPIAVARLQLESIRSVTDRCDRRGIGYPGNAIAQIRLRCEARLGMAYERHSSHIDRKTNIFSLTAAQQRELDTTAKRVFTDTAKENKRIFDRKGYDPSAFKVKGGSLAKALKVASDTIELIDESMLHLRFCVNDRVVEQWQHGSAYGDDHGMDGYFGEASSYLYGIQYDAWRMLLLVSAMIGGSAHKSAVYQTAREFLGAGEKDGDFITTAIMQYLNVGYRMAGITYVADENEFRKEIADAVEKFK